MAIKVKDWYELRDKLPGYIKNLIDLCIEFEKMKVDLNTSLKYNAVDKKEFSSLVEISNNILEEYYAIIMSRKYNDSKLMNDVKTDIYRCLNMFYDSNGKKILWPRTGESEVSCQLIQQVSSFIFSRIYNSLNQTFSVIMKRENFLNRFVIISTFRAGREPGTGQEKRDLEDLFGGGEEKKEKKNVTKEK